LTNRFCQIFNIYGGYKTLVIKKVASHFNRKFLFIPIKKLFFSLQLTILMKNLTPPGTELIVRVVIIVIVAVLAVLVYSIISIVAKVSEKASTKSQAIKDLEQEKDEGSLKDGITINGSTSSQGREVEICERSSNILILGEFFQHFLKVEYYFNCWSHYLAVHQQTIT